MNYRVASILPSESVDIKATKTLDLKIADPISRITIQIKGKNENSDPIDHPAKMIPKIEVVDGSDVLFSLSGLEAQALNYYDKGYMPHTVLNYITPAYAIATFDIDFGRYLYDPILALDPKKFTNPQLKITHDLDLGGCTSAEADLSVFAHIFDQKAVTPTGLLMSKEQYSYTLVADAKEQIELATDFPYRKILLQSLADILQPFEQYSKIKLSEDNDRKVVINDERASDLLKLLRMWPPFTENIYGLTVNGDELFYCAASYEKAVSLVGVAADADAYLNETYGSSVSINDGAEAKIEIIVTGLAPHGTLCIPFGVQGEIEDWYKVAEIGSLRMTITAGSGASGTVEFISQQERSY